MAKFSAQHYNAIAKEIRELFPANSMFSTKDIHSDNNVVRGTLTTLALNLTHRFKDDNERFDPHRFLNACSPDTDLYPLSELWED